MPLPTTDFQLWLESQFDADGNWAGAGGAASGFLIVANDTKHICLALRSANVHSKVNGRNVQIQCWGTIGGAIEGDPVGSAKKEVAEETGFHGPYLSITPAYTFSQGTFKYYNFIAVVPHEFGYSGHSWETDAIEWVDYQMLPGSSYKGHPFHDGLKLLLQDVNTKTILQSLTLN